MSSSAATEQIAAEARHARDRLALTRAKVYSGREVPAARMRELERALEGAERRLHDALLRDRG